MKISNGTTGSPRWVARALAVAVVAAAASAPASAQVRFIPQAGMYVPVADLGTVGSGGAAVDVAKKQSTLALGVAIDIAPQSKLGFRINGIYGTSSEIPVSRVGCTGCEARSTVSALTAALILRPLPELLILRPYLQAGGGIKRYDFDEEDLREEGLEVFLSDQNKVTAQLGAGVDLNLGLAKLVFDLSDYVSGFELGSGATTTHGDTQHDFFFTVGLSIGE